LGRPLEESDDALLRGELSVFETVTDRSSHAFRLHVTLRRPDGEPDRIRWNEKLAFPEYSWMAQVRVWDRDGQWLWPNLPYLLRAHGEERVERYGGIDPGKGIDNDFAAVLIRPLEHESTGADEPGPGPAAPPLVSAEWYPVDAESLDGSSIVHVARSDDFRVRVLPGGRTPESGKLALWLIYADFLGASVPRNWPQDGEWAGGILAYFEVSWQQTANGEFEFGIEQLVPPTGTGFAWWTWSTGSSALKKNLELIYPR
jgi:hypothetical protein